MNILKWDGKPISSAGVFEDIPNDDYHKQLTVAPSISSSGLKRLFADSPRAYFRGSYLNPNRKDQKPSEALTFGRAAHHLLLGEKDFRKHFTVRPDEAPDGRAWHHANKSCQEWIETAEAAGLTILKPSDIEVIRAMADALAKEPLVQAGILEGLIEHSFVWRDEETGVWVKWRPDCLPTSSLQFSDLKTASSISDEDLEYAFGNYGYFQQAALGAEACRQVLGREMESFSLVFIEKTDNLPLVRVKQARPGDIDVGERCNRAALRLFARCLDAGEWPGPGGLQSDAEFIGLHPKAAERAMFRVEEIERQLEIAA